ncbi:hypothetical protein KC845_01660 [Candidatus Kaiserbacteria bacterium]|nr:hypothetical protein [Candidatus Kaiserbacteria bacterium]
MFKTENTVGTLKTIAMVVGLAIIFWSLGLPYLQLAGAANITEVSDTLSTSAPSTEADHTIYFIADGAYGSTSTITVTFDPAFTMGSVDETDVNVSGSTYGSFGTAGVPAADCTGGEDMSAVFAGNVLTLTLCQDDGGQIEADEEVTIVVGGTNKITNPAVGTYDIDITSGPNDSGSTIVAIVDEVTVTAAVDTIFTFSVAGVAGGQVVNGATTTGATTATTIPFGELSDGSATTTAQDLQVGTNASNGYSVTVQLDGALQSSTGADINGFADGSDTDVPALWSAPSGTLGLPDTYGHWGVTSDDLAIPGRGTDFLSARFIAASTTPRLVMGHNGPADSTTAGIGAARVGYQIEITSLQEAGDDYSAVLTYVATPSF